MWWAEADRGAYHRQPVANPIVELSALQEERGFLSDDDLRTLSARLRIPLYELQGVASFYPHFRREPPAALRVGVCRDLVCRLRGGGELAARLASACAERPGATCEEISCPGLCDRAPACLVNDAPADGTGALAALSDGTGALAALSDGAAPQPEPASGSARRWRCDPYPEPDERYGQVRELARSGSYAAALARIADSGLRGMGGAGFPTGRKWALVREQPGEQKAVVCNADESEPGAFKDRVILEELPHLVVEGATIAGLVVGATEGWVYLRHEYRAAREALQREIDHAREHGVLGGDACGSGRAFDLRIFVSPGGYVLGEETALLEALEGKRGEPRNKPPFPGTRGLHGRPTLINNVETLAHVPRVLREGRADLKLFSVSGDVVSPGVFEASLGTRFSDLLARAGGLRDRKALLAFLPGGASTAFLPADRADVPMTWDGLREAGSALGAGAVVVVGEGADLLALAGNLTAFFRNESCGKCVPCRIGTEKAVALIDAREPAGLALLPELNEVLAETSLCGLGQVALTPVLSVLERFSGGEKPG